MFEKARFKLTAWYLVIIMAISLFFSFAVYTGVNTELNRLEKTHLKIQEEIKEGVVVTHDEHFIKFGKPDPEFIKESKQRLIWALGLINLAILLFSGAAGYFLAGRTLRPIKRMIDEQNRFITDASHELRTPLTALRSEIEVGLRNKNLSLNDAKKLLNSNLEEVINLQTLSDNLLELAQNGRLIDPKNFEEVSLSAIINKAVKKVEPLSLKKQIKLNIKVKDITINGIADRLIEVFVILLDNAIKYSINKGGVEIVAQKDKDQVSVSVIDHGVGIEADDLPHIFERFYRVSKSRNKSIAGYGLGLAIAKKIIDSHHATITVESIPDKGTTFKLLFRLIPHN
ncbi:MAG TPA: ATP-binding protein [Patescibacteria group bacterium]